MKPDGLIDEIKSRIDIHELISEYVDLKRAGQNYKGLCPFHSEKTPSFMVNPSRQIFHCFGCNKGGDIFSFIMNHENMSFGEAISFLANKAGVSIESSHANSASKGIKETVLSIHEEALTFYRQNLRDAKSALAYLTEREISSEIIEQFSLGYARGDSNSLLKRLKSAGYSEVNIRASGLAYFGGDSPHDFFRDRLIFPIFDLRGKPVAFGGRSLSSSKHIPKYLNSPESPIFKKSESCYALNLAKNHIVKKGYTIVVEGYFDVIVCHQFGFLNTIAPLGTALTSGHLRKLRKIADKVLLTFDADTAGLAAARRAVELAYSEGMLSKIVMLSEGEDPDTFLRKYGAGDFRKFLAKALSPVQFFILRAGKSRIDGVRQFLAILSSCQDGLLRDDALRELADLASEKVLRAELANLARKRLSVGHQVPSAAQPQTFEKYQGAYAAHMSKEEEILLGILLNMPRIGKHIAERIKGLDIEHPLVRRIFETVMTYDSDEYFSPDVIMASCSPEEQALLSRVSIDPGIDMDEVMHNIEGCVNKIAVRQIDKKIIAARTIGDEKLLSSLHAEKKGLLQKNVELFKSKKSK
ncbi:MAG TPA: DNA primase [Dissulfurispiraceae bacterium]|nr:DNA primase [Dissulfurispiraceae bacterium]